MQKPSTHPGMGSILHDDGCTVRVWAPNAQSVAVGGAGVLAPAIDLARDPGDGWAYWSAFIPGVRAGDEYRFHMSNGQGQRWSRIDPHCRDATSSSGNAIVCDTNFDWGDVPFRTPDWNSAIIYELHVGTFNQSPGSGEGTFDTLVSKLQYLADLGVNYIQLMPAFEFDNDRSVGYNPALPFALESAYGKAKAFRNLVKEAHARGIGVILDVVYNHFGPGALTESLWTFDGWQANGGGGIYFYNDDRRFTPWGERPDYGRHEVRQFIVDNAMTWLHEYRVDGLRWDSTGCCRMNRGFCKDECCGESLADGWGIMRWVNDEIDRQVPWKLCIAEDLHDNEAITSRTSEGGAGFDAQWDPSFLHPVRNSVIAAFDEWRDMYAVKSAIEHRYGGDASKRIVFLESHNEASARRLTEQIWAGDAANWFAKKRSTLAAGILFTSPGVPMMFQGGELLEWGAWNDQNALDWRKLAWFAGIHDLYRDLMHLRRNWYNNTRGLRGQHVNVHHVNQADKLIAYHRWADGGPGDDVVVIANFADRTYASYHVGFPRGGTWYVRFNSDYRGYSSDFGSAAGYDTTAYGDGADAMPCSANIGIGPYSVLILSQ